MISLRNIYLTKPYGHNGFIGNLGLSDKDEDALVKFMKTLSDG